jgi:hypothetical protein
MNRRELFAGVIGTALAGSTAAATTARPTSPTARALVFGRNDFPTGEPPVRACWRRLAMRRDLEFEVIDGWETATPVGPIRYFLDDVEVDPADANRMIDWYREDGPGPARG